MNLDRQVDLDKVLAKASYLKGLADQYRGDTGMKAVAMVCPQNEFEGGFYSFRLFGLPVFPMGTEWGLVVVPEGDD